MPLRIKKKVSFHSLMVGTRRIVRLMAKSPPACATKHVKWDFLDPWFEELRGLITVDDADRADTEGRAGMGRDPATDWRLLISWPELVARAKDLKMPFLCTNLLPRVREALLLCGSLASVDNAAWIYKLETVSHFQRAPFMEFTAHELQADFVLEITKTTVANWPLNLRLLCGVDHWSDAFERSFEQLVAAAPVKCTRPRLRFRIKAERHEGAYDARCDLDFHLLDNTADSIRQLQEISANHQLLTAFELDSLQLDLRELHSSSRIMKALQDVVQLAIPIDYLKLMNGDGGYPGTEEYREAWVALVCTLCGNPLTTVVSSVSIRKLTVADHSTAHDVFLFLCSACPKHQASRNRRLTERHISTT